MSALFSSGEILVNLDGTITRKIPVAKFKKPESRPTSLSSNAEQNQSVDLVSTLSGALDGRRGKLTTSDDDNPNGNGAEEWSNDSDSDSQDHGASNKI